MSVLVQVRRNPFLALVVCSYLRYIVWSANFSCFANSSLPTFYITPGIVLILDCHFLFCCQKRTEPSVFYAGIRVGTRFVSPKLRIRGGSSFLANIMLGHYVPHFIVEKCFGRRVSLKSIAAMHMRLFTRLIYSDGPFHAWRYGLTVS